MTSRVSGFTIIEVMLFLAVSSLLMAGLLASIGGNLNAQRYTDGVQSFKNTLQDQFAATTSVQNNRSGSVLTCNEYGLIVETPGGGSEGRGQGDCMLVGRYLIVRNTEVSSYPVTARKGPPLVPAPADDVELIRNGYAINLDTKSVERSSLQWGVRLAWPVEGPYMRAAGASREIALLFIRSPETGQVYVFSSNKVPPETQIVGMSPSTAASFINSMIKNVDSLPGRGSRTMCVDPMGLIVGGGRMAIRLESFAASQAAFRVVSNEQLESEGAGTQC